MSGCSTRRTQGCLTAMSCPLTAQRSLLFVLFTIHTAFTAAPQYRVDYRRGYMVNLGETINLTCPYDTPFYKWTTTAQTSWSLSEDQVFSLKADSISVSGKYICSAVNGFGHNLAEFNIKVIDKFSPSLKQSCAHLSNGRISESGPCFLKTYTEPELAVAKVWGDDVTLSCESVAVEGLAERLTFSWAFYPQNPEDPKTATPEKPAPEYPDVHHDQHDMAATMPHAVKDLASEKHPQEIVSRFTGSTLKLRKITLSHAGEYRCSVNAEPQIGDPPSLVNISPLTRTFGLRVHPRSEGAIIQGPHNVTVSVDRGRDASFACEISKEEHRSATIRWGKYISMEEAGMHDFRNSEVLHWSGGTYIVLPTILPQDVKQFLDIPKPLAVSSPGSRKSRLVVPVASPRDVGLYICSVITENGRDDHKFVHVSLRDGDHVVGLSPDTDTSPRHLTTYIAVPICVFLICICAVASLIIRNQNRQSRQRGRNDGQKSFFIAPGVGTSVGKPSLNSSQRFLDHSSLTGSASMTFTRSDSPPRHGKSTVVSSKVPSAVHAAHMQMRPSPISSATSTSACQIPASQFTPSHLQPPYIYPSPATECVYFTADGTPMAQQPYSSPAVSTFGRPAYMNAHVPNVDYQPYTPMKLDPTLPGFGKSGESSVCTTDGFEQPGYPSFMAGGGPHFNPVISPEPNGRVPCVSPSSGKDAACHLQLMQRTESAST